MSTSAFYVTSNFNGNRENVNAICSSIINTSYQNCRIFFGFHNQPTCARQTKGPIIVSTMHDRETDYRLHVFRFFHGLMDIFD